MTSNRGRDTLVRAVADIGDFDLNLLRALLALLEERSVSKAAARLGLTPPSVSHALARLRTALGDPILVRAGRVMEPSPRAVELLPRLRALMDEVREVVQPPAAFEPASSEREFVIHGSDYVILVLGLALDRIVADAAPGVSLKFMPNVVGDPDLVRSGAIDLAIGVYAELYPEIQVRTLFDEQLVCVVRREHPDVRRRMTLETFTRLAHVQIAPRGRAGGIIDDALAAEGKRRRVIRKVPYFTSGMAMVAQTDCVLTVPHRIADSHADVFGLRVLSLPLDLSPYPMRQLSHPRWDGDEGHRWLRECVARACKATRPRRR